MDNDVPKISFTEFSCREIRNDDPALKLELCARTCYKSEDKIKDGSAEKLLKAVIARGHESVLEHFRLTVDASELSECYTPELTHRFRILNSKFIDVFRQTASGNIRAWRDEIRMQKEAGEKSSLSSTLAARYSLFFADLAEPNDCYPKLKVYQASDYHTVLLTTNVRVTHEFVRHRSLSFSQESTRYCNYGGSFTYVLPTEFGWEEQEMAVWKKQIEAEATAYCKLLELTKKPEQASAVLSKSLKADIVITGTDTQWRDFFKLRLAPDAHPEARKCAQLIHQIIS